MLKQWLRPPGRARRLGEADRARAMGLLRANRLTAILAAAHLDQASASQYLLGVEDDAGEEFTTVAWSGPNLVPVGSADGVDAIAAWLRREGRRASSIVGRADLVQALWERLGPAWAHPREARLDQPCMVATAPSAVEPDPRVRAAAPEEFDLVFPASVAMFTEEVGYDPTRSGRAYSWYVRSLLARQRSYIVTEQIGGRETVVFKADVGALWDGIAQVQGVWTHPEVRGRGLGTAAMTAVTQLVQRDVAPTVSLYVNGYNLAARRVYEKAGFTQQATYATILY